MIEPSAEAKEQARQLVRSVFEFAAPMGVEQLEDAIARALAEKDKTIAGLKVFVELGEERLAEKDAAFRERLRVLEDEVRDFGRVDLLLHDSLARIEAETTRTIEGLKTLRTGLMNY